MGRSILDVVRIEIVNEVGYWVFSRLNDVNRFELRQWFAILLNVFNNWNAKINSRKDQLTSQFQLTPFCQYSLVTPSLMMSCILQQEDMILMLRLSMTSTFQSPFFLTVSAFSTSFIISVQIKKYSLNLSIKSQKMSTTKKLKNYFVQRSPGVLPPS